MAMQIFISCLVLCSLGNVLAETPQGCQDGSCRADIANLLQVSSSVNDIQQAPLTRSQAPQCLNVASWNKELEKQDLWKKYSQGNQDSILASLFHDSHLGATNKYFVEFGFHDVEASSTPNTKLLAENGWTGLRMDGNVLNAAIAAKQYLHEEFITPENIVSLFNKYDVPQEPDYVSVDIDSCDLWVFLAITKKYRPRAFTVEYNPKYPVSESKTNVCKDKAGKGYTWEKDDLYGASLAAIHKAAGQMGYAMVAIEFKMDIFLVRKDLVCPGTEMTLSEFGHYAGYPFEQWRKANATELKRWTVDY